MPRIGEQQNAAADEAARLQEAQSLAILLLSVFVGMSIMVWWGRRDAGGIELSRRPENASQYRVDLNRANEMELQHLPGVGPALAARIVAERQAGGSFRSLGDLTDRVRGIGPSLRDRIALFVTPMAIAEPTDEAVGSSPRPKRSRKASGAAKAVVLLLR